jgi:BMFP domain-containing protein YqiC
MRHVAQLKADNGTLAEERAGVERQYQAICEQWRSELDARTREFEAARAQILQPRDLDLLRVKMAAELREPWERKTARLAQARAHAASVHRRCCCAHCGAQPLASCADALGLLPYLLTASACLPRCD